MKIGRIVAVAATMTALLGVTALPAGAATTPRSTLTFHSAAGDYIGQGKSYRYTSTTGATFAVNRLYEFNKSITVSINQNNYEHWWYLDLTSNDGQELHKGRFVDAQRAAFADPGHPGLDFSGDGRGCNELSGQFTVHRITRAADGHITKLNVTFVQHCENANAPVLKGELHYNAA